MKVRSGDFGGMFSGVIAPDGSAVVTVGHAVAGPTELLSGDNGKCKFVTYQSLPEPLAALRREFQYVVLAEKFLRGGADIALGFKEKPADLPRAVRAVQATLADVSKNSLFEVTGRSSPVHIREGVSGAAVTGRGVWIPRHKNVLVLDVGFPGLSGSTAFVPGGLLGMYTARLASAGSFPHARKQKLESVVSNCRRMCGLPTTPPLPHGLPTMRGARTPRSLAARIFALTLQVSQMRSEFSQQISVLQESLDAHVRRRAVVLPLPFALDDLKFLEWRDDSKHTVDSPAAVHAFDSLTDVDYGMPVDWT